MDIKRHIRDFSNFVFGFNVVPHRTENKYLEQFMKRYSKYMYLRRTTYELENTLSARTLSHNNAITQCYINDFLSSKFNSYKKIAAGAYGIVFRNTNIPNVVFKVVCDDDAYNEYAEACMKYKYSWMPKIYDFACMGIFSGDTYVGHCRIYVMEELVRDDTLHDVPVTRASETIRALSRHNNSEVYANVTEHEFFRRENLKRYYKRKTTQMEKEVRQVFFELNKKMVFSWDCREANVLVRIGADGTRTPVIADPIHNGVYR